MLRTGGAAQQQELGPGQGSVLLRGLEPGTDYEVTVSALLGRGVGSATSLTARTGEKAGCTLRDGWTGRKGEDTADIPRALGRPFCGADAAPSHPGPHIHPSFLELSARGPWLPAGVAA